MMYDKLISLKMWTANKFYIEKSSSLISELNVWFTVFVFYTGLVQSLNFATKLELTKYIKGWK